MHMHMRMHTHMRMCMFMRMCMRLDACMCVYVCMYACMHACVHVCMCVYITVTKHKTNEIYRTRTENNTTIKQTACDTKIKHKHIHI